MRYAKDTEVPVSKSKEEIEKLLIKYGADQFMSAWKEGKAVIQFRAENRYIRFLLPLPSMTEKRFLKTPVLENSYTPEQTQKLWEQACRQAWRALGLVIKAKLEAVESGITTFEEEFFSHVVLPNGKTVFEETEKQIAIAYETGKMKPMLEWMGDK